MTKHESIKIKNLIYHYHISFSIVINTQVLQIARGKIFKSHFGVNLQRIEL